MTAPPLGAGGSDDAWELAGARPRSSPRARLRLPVAISLLIQVPGALFGWRGPGPRAGSPSFALSADWPLALVITVVACLALLAARRWPGPVVAFVTAAAIADLLLRPEMPGPPFVALAFAIVGAIARNARVWAWVSAGVMWVTVLLASLALVDFAPSRVAFSTLGVLAVLGIGEAVRARRERAAAYRRALAQRRQTAAEAERVRIARELHDVLAHSLSSINVQAGVGLHLIERDPAAGAAALAEIKAASRVALDEVRSVLGVLRSDGAPGSPLAPEPELSQLERLAASVTGQGVLVELELHPESITHDAPRPIQLALYRIVQESLTNVVRHAQANHVTVSVRADATHYIAEIVDDGAATSADDTAGGGRGLLGMRERATLLGGTLEARPQPGGGFRVCARIPRPEEEQS
ncbi:MAG: sensor histidine kinase [Salinibacterium sp.]|nr:histidine kinase [Salinibacterium sp.]MBF0672143.1 sensor histidine kinase [Salinibacterium sp.]